MKNVVGFLFLQYYLKSFNIWALKLQSNEFEIIYAIIATKNSSIEGKLFW